MNPTQHLQHNVMHPGIANQPGPVPLSLTVPGQIRTPINQNNVLHLQRQTQLGLPYTPQPLPPGVGPEELMSGPMNNIYITNDMNIHQDVTSEMHNLPMSHQDSEDMDSYAYQQYQGKTVKQGIKLRPPKRANSAYTCFSKKIYKQTRDELSGAKQSEIFSRIATMWREMTDEQKEPYVKESNTDKDRHKQEESNYKRLRKEVEKNYTPRTDDTNPLNAMTNSLRGSKTLQRAMQHKDSEKLASLLLSANNNDINSTLMMLKESANIIIHAGEQIHIDKMPDYSTTGTGGKRNQKRYHCPHIGCNKVFAWKSNMTVHLRTHDVNRRREYVCTFPNCNKAFYDNQHLKQHQWIHTRNPEGYSCPQPGCNKKYATRGGLQLHVKAHHKLEKKFKCDIDGCDRAFVRRTDLKVHILRVHSDCKPHPCPHPNCSKSYVTLAELKRHFTTHNHTVLQSMPNALINNSNGTTSQLVNSTSANSANSSSNNEANDSVVNDSNGANGNPVNSNSVPNSSNPSNGDNSMSSMAGTESNLPTLPTTIPQLSAMSPQVQSSPVPLNNPRLSLTI